MKKIFVIFILGAVTTCLFAQTNYTVTFSANVTMDSIQVKNKVSGESKILYNPDNTITLQKNEKSSWQETSIETVEHTSFLQQTSQNTVVVNMEKSSQLTLTLYSSKGNVVSRYVNNVNAGQNTFQVGATAGVYVLVASVNNQTASVKLFLSQNSQVGIFEVESNSSDILLKSTDDVITFDEGDMFEFTGYYKNQTDVKTAVIIGNKQIVFALCAEPNVSTTNAINITNVSATVGGNVTDDNCANVTERGVCWSTTDNPTVSDNKIMSDLGTGSFTVSLMALSENTKYFVRAYAVNSIGTAYGETISFTTTSIPVVSTGNVSNISAASAIVVGNVINDNGSTVSERGVCWATTENPTISNNTVKSDTGIGIFSVTLFSLSEETTYYARAYARNSIGVAYGEQITFTTKKLKENGAIMVEFSVSSNKKVYFSLGNLQYKASTKTWRFAENQYDMAGYANINISSSYSGWIDLFNWGASGGDGQISPYELYSSYYSRSKDMAETNADWGVCNKISNGGNQAGLWRTLTREEWDYLRYYRTNASLLYGIATVNGVNGCVFLPDNWIIPTGVTFVCKANGDYAQNTYSASEWKKMEENGAIFLPAAGYRNGTALLDVGSNGYYWSSSANSYGVNCLFFLSNDVYTNFTTGGSGGRSVRLVQDVE